MHSSSCSYGHSVSIEASVNKFKRTVTTNPVRHLHVDGTYTVISSGESLAAVASIWIMEEAGLHTLMASVIGGQTPEL